MELTKGMLMAMGISEREADNILKAAANVEDNIDQNIDVENPAPEIKTSKAEIVEKPLEPSDITSIADMAKYAKGQIVKLPGFAENQPFIARLRRPSMLVLVKSGKIPNSLLDTANSLFNNGKPSSGESEKAMKDMYDVLCIMAESSLVEPTYKEITNSGVELTDEQLIAIFNYSQQGIEGLKSFRKK